MYNYSQKDPRWSEMLIVPGYRMKGFGCLIDLMAHNLSVLLKREVLPSEFLSYCQKKHLLTPDGKLQYAAVYAFAKEHHHLVSSWPTILGATWIVRQVDYGPSHSHFVGYVRVNKTIFDPLDGQYKSEKAYPKVLKTLYFRAS